MVRNSAPASVLMTDGSRGGQYRHMTFTYTKAAARLPAQDLDRARAWYADKLGLEPADERPGGVLYRIGGCEFALFASSGAASGDHTQMGFEVDDIEAAV